MSGTGRGRAGRCGHPVPAMRRLAAAGRGRRDAEARREPCVGRGRCADRDPGVDRDPCADRDAGAGSVLVLALVAVALVVAGAVASVGQVGAARAHAQGAADLAALAGAARLVATGGTGESCTLAERVAARNQAAVASCTVVRPQVLEVRVTGRTPFGDATAVARAGPPSEREP